MKMLTMMMMMMMRRRMFRKQSHIRLGAIITAQRICYSKSMNTKPAYELSFVAIRITNNNNIVSYSLDIIMETG